MADFIAVLRKHLVQIYLQRQRPLFQLFLFDLLLFEPHSVSHISDHYDQLFLVITLNISLFENDCSVPDARFLLDFWQLDVVHRRFDFKRLNDLRKCEYAIPEICQVNR